MPKVALGSIGDVLAADGEARRLARPWACDPERLQSPARFPKTASDAPGRLPRLLRRRHSVRRVAPRPLRAAWKRRSFPCLCTAWTVLDEGGPPACVWLAAARVTAGRVHLQ